MQEGLEEPESFCRLMMTNTIEDLLDPVKRARIPSGFNYKRLVLILGKYRCCIAAADVAILWMLTTMSYLAQHCQASQKRCCMRMLLIGSLVSGLLFSMGFASRKTRRLSLSVLAVQGDWRQGVLHGQPQCDEEQAA